MRYLYAGGGSPVDGVEKRLDTRSCLLQGDHMGGLCGKPEGKKVRESFLKGDPLYVCVTQSACRLPRA